MEQNKGNQSADQNRSSQAPVQKPGVGQDQSSRDVSRDSATDSRSRVQSDDPSQTRDSKVETRR